MHGAWKTLGAGKRGGRDLRIPDEYICDLCGYMFLDGEVPSNFCPNCGSSTVTKELSYDEFLDDEAFISILNYHTTVGGL
jgi:DNA-directed RNA polymerase subunit RPC12/RpoP